MILLTWTWTAECSALVAGARREGYDTIRAFGAFGAVHALEAGDFGGVRSLDLLDRQVLAGNAVFLVLAGDADDGIRHCFSFLQMEVKQKRETLLSLNIVIPRISSLLKGGLSLKHLLPNNCFQLN